MLTDILINNQLYSNLVESMATESDSSVHLLVSVCAYRFFFSSGSFYLIQVPYKYCTLKCNPHSSLHAGGLHSWMLMHSTTREHVN